MSGLFHEIPDAQAILRLPKGVFRQVKLYQRNGHVYAAWGTGYVKLLSSGWTSNPNVSYEFPQHETRMHSDGFYMTFRDRLRQVG